MTEQDLIQANQVDYLKDFTPGFSVHILAIKPKELGVDGSILKFEPGSSTKVMVINPGWKFMDVVVHGSGWLVATGADQQVIVRRIEAGRDLAQIEYNAGLTMAYIAGADGLEIHETTNPPYKEEAETEISREDPIGLKQNPKFWEVYDGLLAFEKTNAVEIELIKSTLAKKDES
jgi:hypothetical protein